MFSSNFQEHCKDEIVERKKQYRCSLVKMSRYAENYLRTTVRSSCSGDKTVHFSEESRIKSEESEYIAD